MRTTKEGPLSQAESDEWERLNAFVDGELPEGERLRLRERARTDPVFAVQVAGLRHLKTEIRAAGHGRTRPPVLAASAAVMLVGLVAGALWFGRPDESSSRAAPTQLLSRLAAALDPSQKDAVASPRVPVVPALDLGGAGFKLASSVVAPSFGAPLLIYEGPHGCRIGLTTSVDAMLPSGLIETDAVSATTWTADGRRFTLVTRGMDPERLRDLASALELLTRGGDAEQVSLALRRSSQGRTCLG